MKLIKQDIKNLMGNNASNDVIDKTFDRLSELSDSLKSFFDQMFGKMDQIGHDFTTIK